MGDEGAQPVVQFPGHDGQRSTQRTGRDVFAHAAAAADAALASSISAERHWRTAYPAHLRRLTAQAAASPRLGVAMARAGLERVHATFELASPAGTGLLADTIETAADPTLTTRTVAGEAPRRDDLVIPYRGTALRGGDLLRAAADWSARGIVEPPVVTALTRLVERPEWLDLRGRWFAVLGAGAEMAPTERLLAWGAEVVAVDLPHARIWRHLENSATRGAGRMHVPVDEGGTYPLGADLISDAPRILAWLATFDHPLVFGNYAYADGATFVRLSVAADAVCAALRRRRGDIGVACLATPTDAFAVPAQVVHETRQRSARSGVLARGVRRISAGRLLVPNHRETLRTDDGEELGIADALVLQQGPNYALAKRLQRWRAIATHADGAFGAVHVAPPTRTRSVLKSRALAAAYAGAPMFGIETFEPATSRALMAALLIHDLRAHDATPEHETLPEHRLTAAAAHGGLWRVAWEPRTALPLAVLRGAPALLSSPARHAPFSVQG